MSSLHSRGRAQALTTMAWPMIVTQASLALMQFADVWMVSKLGKQSLAAITPAALMVSAFSTFGSGYLTVVNTLVGQTFGAGLKQRCVEFAWQGIWSALILGFAVLAFFPAAPYVFTVFGHPQAVRVLEVQYFEICLMAILPQLISVAIGGYFLATHQPLKAMAGTLFAVLCNLLLNYLLIFGSWGFPRLGFAGAAWGTLIASTMHGMLMLALFLVQKNAHRLGVFKPRVSFKDLQKMYRIGGPAGVQDSVELVAWGIVLVFLIGKFGETHLAAASVLIRCMQLSFLPADGFGSAILALVANAIGSGRHDEARAFAALGFRVIAVYMTGIAILVYVFRYPIMRLFSDDPAVVLIGAQAMICVSLFQVFDAMNVTYAHALQGAGDSAWPSMVNFLLCVVVLCGGGMLVVHYAPYLESFGIWSAATVLLASQGIAFWARWTFGPWRLIDLRRDGVTSKDREVWAIYQDLKMISQVYAQENSIRFRLSAPEKPPNSDESRS